jgi:hypothetical protein
MIKNFKKEGCYIIHPAIRPAVFRTLTIYDKGKGSILLQVVAIQSYMVQLSSKVSGTKSSIVPLFGGGA